MFAYGYFACEKMIRQLILIYSSHSALQQFNVHSWMTYYIWKVVWYNGLFVFEKMCWDHLVGVEIRGWRDGAKGKKTHGYGQHCGDCWGEGSFKRLKGNVKIQ